MTYTSVTSVKIEKIKTFNFSVKTEKCSKKITRDRRASKMVRRLKREWI